jgi:two-component system response regulator QseB
MRSQGINTPVLILTAYETIEDRVKGLDSGADDYMVKPFDMDELNARLRALIRRRAERGTPYIEYRGVKLDPTTQTVYIDDTPANISRREFTLLEKLLNSAGKVLSRDMLIQTLYGWDEEIDSNALEVHIHNLRKKLGDRINIRTVRGVGYLIE